MRQHDPLRVARRAGSVEDRREIIRFHPAAAPVEFRRVVGVHERSPAAGLVEEGHLDRSLPRRADLGLDGGWRSRDDPELLGGGATVRLDDPMRNDRRRIVRPAVEDHDVPDRARVLRGYDDLLELTLRADQRHAAARISEDVDHLLGAHRRVERNTHRSQGLDGEIGDGPLGPVLGNDGDPVPRRHAEPAQETGEAADVRHELRGMQETERPPLLGAQKIGTRRACDAVEDVEQGPQPGGSFAGG